VSEERVAWSVPLPEFHSGILAAAPDGRVLVSNHRYLALVGPSGEPDWLVRPEVGSVGSPLVTADRMARLEDDRYVVRDLAGGAVVAAVENAEPMVRPVAGAAGEFWCARRAGDRAAALVRVGAADGSVRGAWRLPDGAPFGLAVHGDGVVVAGGTLLRGYDAVGVHRWTADRDGFRADPADASPGPGRVSGPPVALPDGRLVAELYEPLGRGFYVFDPGARRVDRVSPPVGVHRPVVATPDNRLALMGPTDEDGPDIWWTVLLVEPAGTPLWSHRLVAEPIALLAAGGGVVAVASPSLERWRRYHAWQDLSEDCFVACLGPTGERLWTWPAPVPLTYQPAADDAGTVYVATTNRLWALR
jgi:hypothetical protein